MGSLALIVTFSFFQIVSVNAQSKGEPQNQEKPETIKLIMGSDGTFETHKPKTTAPKNFRVLSSGELVPFNPRQKGISLNKEKKKRTHCVQVKCPPTMKPGIKCWKCKKMKARPKTKPKN